MGYAMGYVMGSFLGHFLDPLGFTIAILGSLFIRKPWQVLLVGLITASIVETILTTTQYTRTWGEGIVIGVVASSLHAAIGFAIVKAFKDHRRDKKTRADPMSTPS
jgi:ABC-type thiamin/hydroxymethylpyrimidine transport system permease subunit